MPDLALERIVKNLEYKSIISLQKVSQSLYIFIDVYKPDFKLTHIEIDISQEKVQLILKSLTSEIPVSIEYKDHENGCLVVCENREKLLKSENFSNVFFKDLEQIMVHQDKSFKKSDSSLEEFQLTCHTVPERLKVILKSQRKLIRTNSFTMKTSNAKEVMEILTHICPKTLKEISLQNFDEGNPRTIWKLEDVVASEQWESAEVLEIIGFQVRMPAAQFSHFNAANVMVTTISAEDLLFLKETLVNRPSSKYFYVKYEYLTNIERIHTLFGNGHLDGVQLQTNRGSLLPMPNNDKSLLYVFYSPNFAQFSIMSMSL